ncbi:MAG: DNA primase [Candidatus Gracilibacteria bacterium]|jgi:DNA primase
MDPVQEIKSKLSIEDIVAPFVQLKRSGKYLKACCPFHSEKTPSFYVSPERQLAYCFSCHKGGDMFQFIQDIESLDFRGALELLADKAHVDLPKFSGKQEKVSKDVKDRLKLICDDANNFFVQKLHEKGDAEKVYAYLKARGLTKESIQKFQLGFAPEGRDELYRHLLAKGHEKQDILESSLALARDSGAQEVSDRFKLRLMVPIHNAQGEVIAFGGRALKKGDQPKYLNSSEFALYNKSSVLYNLNRAKNAIREQDFVVVVEGYFDGIASDQAGVENAVATCGTALTEEQLKLIRRYTKKIAFAFDKDAAGQAALLRGVELAQPLGFELFVVEVPLGKDAADSVKEDPKLWQDAVSTKKPYLDYFLEQGLAKFDLKTAQGKRDFTDYFIAILKGTAHPIEMDHYIKELSKLVGSPSRMLYDYLNQIKSQRTHTRVKTPKEEKVKLSKRDRLSREFVALLLAFPKVFFELWKSLEHFDAFQALAESTNLIQRSDRLTAEHHRAFYSDFAQFLGEERSIYKRVLDYYNAQDTVDDLFYAGLEDGMALSTLALGAEKDFSSADEVKKEFEKLVTKLYFESLNSLPEVPSAP